MTKRVVLTRQLLAATAVCGSLAASRSAWADSTTAQIGAIEKQIRALEGQLNHMKTDLASRDAEVRAARKEAAAAARQAREAEERGGPMRYDVNGRPLPPSPLSAPPGYFGPSGSPYMNVAGGGGGGYMPSGPKLKQGQFQLGAVRVTLGGFLDTSSVYRSRNEATDVFSDYNAGIPYNSSPNAHQSEFRESGRETRLSLLAEANPNSVTTLAGFAEVDFLGAGSSSNSRESNSYVPRARSLYATYARSDWDFYILGGQTWSLLTMNKVGITPRQEDIPLTIDLAYVPGFVWTRNPGIRFVKGFDDHRINLGLSFESPQANYYTGPNGTGANDGTVLATSAGISTLNPDATYSDDVAPDVIVKGTLDPGWGHYEAFGVMRFLHDRTSVIGSGSNHTVAAGGGGAAAILPIVKGKFELQGNVLAGEGIGRYGPALLPDATFEPDGAPRPLPEIMASVGLVGHPSKSVDLYGYGGIEHITSSEAFTSGGKGYGYGNSLYSNAGCDIEQPGATLSIACTANTRTVVQGTIGGWWKFLKGDFGTMQTGIQYSYTHKTAFAGVGGTPSADQNTVLMSFRYLPFQ